mmetsp:Transcript_35989/g.84581  ORF Transcript_35989/g.84581 Transcript_35989/m.84581 type:complete len:347 (+) Transcript_35989:368-1408(+)
MRVAIAELASGPGGSSGDLPLGSGVCGASPLSDPGVERSRSRMRSEQLGVTSPPGERSEGERRPRQHLSRPPHSEQPASLVSTPGSPIARKASDARACTLVIASSSARRASARALSAAQVARAAASSSRSASTRAASAIAAFLAQPTAAASSAAAASRTICTMCTARPACKRMDSCSPTCASLSAASSRRSSDISCAARAFSSLTTILSCSSTSVRGTHSSSSSSSKSDSYTSSPAWASSAALRTRMPCAARAGAAVGAGAPSPAAAADAAAEAGAPSPAAAVDCATMHCSSLAEGLAAGMFALRMRPNDPERTSLAVAGLSVGGRVFSSGAGSSAGLGEEISCGA